MIFYLKSQKVTKSLYNEIVNCDSVNRVTNTKYLFSESIFKYIR